MSKKDRVNTENITAFQIIKDFFGYPNVSTSKKSIDKLTKAVDELDVNQLSLTELSYFGDLLVQLMTIRKVSGMILKAGELSMSKKKKIIKMYSKFSAA